MSALVGSSRVIRRMPWHANMTELNHLGRALIAKPEKIESKMTKVFTAYQYSDNPITAMLAGTGAEKTITSTAWEWDLVGATTRPGIVVENVLPSGITKPGEYKTEFDIKLDFEWYVLGDTIHPGTTNKKYQCRIQKAPYYHGGGWVYRVRLMSDADTSFVPLKYLVAGTAWGKLYSQYEEASEQSGSTQYALPQTLINRLSRYRKHYKVTGDVDNEVLAVKIPDSNGKMHDSWMKYAEVEYWKQWYKELERGYWYSRSTDTVLGANNRPLFTGAGIQEQLEDSHIHYYSTLTAKLIEEYLMDIFYSRIKPGGGRKVKAFTGEYGMLMFHRAVNDAAQTSGFANIVQDIAVSKTSSSYNAQSLQYGYQFTKYIMTNGAELELIHNPLYDDREVNFELDPVTGYPVESMRFTFLDFAGDGKYSNIKMINKKGGFKHWYVAGGQTPYGAQSNGLGSHSGDYYEIHVLKQCGVNIEDPTRCGELILKRQS